MKAAHLLMFPKESKWDNVQWESFNLDKIRCQIHQNLEGSASEQTLHQVVPSESLTYGEDDNKQGRDLELLPSPSITAGNLTEEQLHVLQKESKLEGWQFSPSDFFIHISSI